MKTLERLQTPIAIALFALALAFAPGCKAADGGVGVIASVYEARNPGERPQLLARYDGNTFLAWGEGAAIGELYIKATGMPLYPPISVAAGKVVVDVRKPHFHWEGTLAEAFPPEARGMLRDAETLAWAIVFQDNGPPAAVGPTP